MNLRSEYGWVICIASALLLFCTAGLAVTGFSPYQPYIISEGGLSNTESSSVLLVRSAFSLVGMLIVTRLIRRFEIRIVVTVSLLICAGAFFVYGLSNSFLMFCIAAALAGIAFGCGGSISASVLITRWFDGHRGLALGLSMAATGVSAVFSAPYVTYVAERYSLRTAFFGEGFFILTAAVIVWAAVRSMPECLHTEPIGAHHHLHTVHTFAAHDAARPLYIGMMIGVLLFGMSANTYHPHISVLYSTSGFGSEDVAALVSIFGASLAIGKFAYGFVIDLIGTFRASCILYVLVLTGLFLSCFANGGSIVLAYLGVGATGIGLAVTTISIAMYASGISTEASYAKTVSRFQMLSAVGGLIFGTVPGIIADMTGSYVPSVVIMFCISLISAVMLIVFYRIICIQDRRWEEEHCDETKRISQVRQIHPEDGTGVDE